VWDVLAVSATSNASAKALMSTAAAAWPAASRHGTGETSAVFTDSAWQPPDRHWGLLLAQGAYDVEGSRLTSEHVLGLVGSDLRLDGVVPPAGFLWQTREDCLAASTDALGLRHVYLREATDWCAVATSSALLAMLEQTCLDQDSIALLAMTGSLLGESTPYQSVRKLRAGESVVLKRGRAHARRRPSARHEVSSAAEEVGASGAVALRTAVEAACRAWPQFELELSGGLDSRLLLAAAGSTWSARSAVTLGQPDDADVRIAQQIAQRAGLEHRIIPLTGTVRQEDPVIVEAVARASRRHDHSGNPLARLVLDVGEARMGPAADGRVSGQGGEYARGFYYAGQRDTATRPGAAERLARWRVLANDRVDPLLLAPDFAAHAKDVAVRRVVDSLLSRGTRWLQATDEYYLEERMHRWVGLDYSVGITERVILSPYFHPAFLRWAAAVSPAAKRGSRALYQTLYVLDPALADVPLAGSHSPATLSGRSFSSRMLRLRRNLHKTLLKAQQHVRRQTRPPAATSAVAAQLTNQWRQEPGQLPIVPSSPFLDGLALEQVLDGTRNLDAASAGLLVTLAGLEHSLHPEATFSR
jgi:asparagine synthase (glutamine-hydrolysing)